MLDYGLQDRLKDKTIVFFLLMPFTRLASSGRNVRTNYVLHVLMLLMYVEIEISLLRVYLYYLY